MTPPARRPGPAVAGESDTQRCAAELDALGSQAPGVLALMAGDEPSARGDHPPPCKLGPLTGEERADGSGGTVVPGFAGHFAVGDDFARLQARDDSADGGGKASFHRRLGGRECSVVHQRGRLLRVAVT